MKVTFGAGCFWHVEEKFRKLKGVLKTTVGYSGGKMKEPSYEEVCTDKTGHVEVCEVEFDPKTISFDELLETFWKMHDPTQVNRQGPDVGTQYKSAIFYENETQKKEAEDSKAKLQEKLGKNIATEILPLVNFYEAEEHHQKYLMKRGKDTCYI